MPRPVSPDLDTRLLRLKAELDSHARTARYLGLDLERPVRALADGYPENAVVLVGRIVDRAAAEAIVGAPRRAGQPGWPDAQGPH